MAFCDPSTLLSQGKAFQQNSKRELQMIIAQLLCNISAGGGGGGGVGAVYGPTTGLFVGGIPTVVPAGDAIAYDANGATFTYKNGAWA